MRTRAKHARRTGGSGAIRQSVTIPATLAAEIRRVAKKRRLTISRALVSLAERGVEAEAAARKTLKVVYERFLGEQEPGRKNEAGRELIKAVFGKDALAEDSLL